MLLSFICSCTCTMTIEGQQQHKTVTATTTTTGGPSDLKCISNMSSPTLSNLCRFLPVVVVVVVTVSCCCSCCSSALCIQNYRITTRKLHNNNSNIQINLHKLFNIYVIISLLIIVVTVQCCYHSSVVAHAQ